MRTLKLPLELTTDASRQEVLRAWLDKGKLSLSLCHEFPDSYRKPIEIWPMLLSDIFHHVVDAIVLETKHGRAFVQNQLHLYFEEVMRSERGSRVGKMKIAETRVSELMDPDVSGDDNCVEIVRIILSKKSIRVLVLVGMWLPDNEESTWGNLLYDLTYMIASSINPKAPEETRDAIGEKVRSYIAKPSTEYSGEYYSR